MPETDRADAAGVNALLRQAMLARAAKLARAGRYADAEVVLGPPERKDPLTLDLLARIRVQKGRLAEAQALWMEASRFDPGNAGYEAALARLAGLGRRSPSGFWLRWLAAVALFLVVAGGISAWLRIQRPRDPAILAKGNHAYPDVRPAETLNLKLAIPGIMERSDGHDTLLRFRDGLFKQRVTLTPAAETVLKELGKRLEPYSRSISLQVLGYCDDRPVTRAIRYEDNRALALARADAVVRYLAANTTLSASIFNLQVGGGNPFPNDNPANRERNRTVEIRVSPVVP